ncbi:hypothetical protein ACTXK7_07310 [Vreelandella alkaliphila]|uniref:hypothetical protein n=1 Tax=Halomonadaceae TaxID=28256 RepID=UPI003F933DD6
MARTPFRAVWNLWVDPDFSQVEKGAMPAPYVDQEALDFQRLRDALDDFFATGINLRIANDYVDVLTVHQRKVQSAENRRFNDLAKRLRLEARKQTGDVIDVSKVWAKRLSGQDRRIVPPPSVIPMVIETADYEDMLHWLMCAKSYLGMGLPFDAVIQSFTGNAGAKEASTEKNKDIGSLPKHLNDMFSQMFSIPYTPQVLLDVASTDPLPAWAKRLDD